MNTTDDALPPLCITDACKLWRSTIYVPCSYYFSGVCNRKGGPLVEAKVMGPKPELKLCKDCKHYKLSILRQGQDSEYADHVCLHPDSIDIVTGEQSEESCYQNRYHSLDATDQNFVCGIEARFWEDRWQD